MTYRAAIQQQRLIRVLIDEGHQQAWSTRPSMSSSMRPEHPEDASYSAAANLLATRDFAIRIHTEGLLHADLLADTDLLVLPHCSDPKWERTTGAGAPTFSEDEIRAIRDFVQLGGGLLVLGETEQDKYGNNLNEVLRSFGLSIKHATVYDYEAFDTTESFVLASVEPVAAVGFTPEPRRACFYRCGTIEAFGDESYIAARTSGSADPPDAGLVGLALSGDGRVAAFADSDLFGDDCLDEFDHGKLLLDTCYWLTQPAFSRHAEIRTSTTRNSIAWHQLRTAVEELRELEEDDGSIDLSHHSEGAATHAARKVIDAVTALAPLFPHEHEYLTAAIPGDIESWIADSFARPDFSRSLAAFHPELSRVDGIEHLVLFPMYTPNGSLKTRFEALIVRVPWPDWLASLERHSFGNPKFVPVELVDGTSGYASECAVLFPETVSAGPGAPNDFGGIFCDREAARLRRVLDAARPALALELPPEVQALISSEILLHDTFVLWDLIHDRAHSHGELPFDPFMVRQRLPFWMYSLEELRCDLAAFCEAGELAANGFAFARYVQYAVLFDRAIRFPITGSRIRNYDGLGGQVLFGFLHGARVIRWRDNRLEIEWSELEPAVTRLRAEIETLYRAGIDMTRVAYWVAAHDFVARYVGPNLGSAWTPDRRVGLDESDPKAWIGRVNDDEFPLSIFFRSLRQRVAAAGAIQVFGPVP